jgi:hypothetical protein
VVFPIRATHKHLRRFCLYFRDCLFSPTINRHATQRMNRTASNPSALMSYPTLNSFCPSLRVRSFAFAPPINESFSSSTVASSAASGAVPPTCSRACDSAARAFASAATRYSSGKSWKFVHDSPWKKHRSTIARPKGW